MGITIGVYSKLKELMKDGDFPTINEDENKCTWCGNEITPGDDVMIIWHAKVECLHMACFMGAFKTNLPEFYKKWIVELI
jgi:hypothetical protein